MIWRYVLPALALVGFGMAAGVVIISDRPVPGTLPTQEPAAAPFGSFVAGAGLVEASTGNIAIGSPVAGVVVEIKIGVGDRVNAGDALFRIDARDLEAQLITASARAKVAEASLQQPQHRLKYLEDLARHDASAVSAETLSEVRDQVATAQAELGLAKAQVEQLNVEIDRRVVRAPMAGRVLQLDMRVGEYVDGMSPLLLFGDDSDLVVRVNVDESEAWRVDPGASAVAFMRGKPDVRIPLTFSYIEPHIIPKLSLTGRATERTDTRVLQVVFGVGTTELPVYVGQQLDVFIEAAPRDR